MCISTLQPLLDPQFMCVICMTQNYTKVVYFEKFEFLFQVLKYA